MIKNHLSRALWFLLLLAAAASGQEKTEPAPAETGSAEPRTAKPAETATDQSEAARPVESDPVVEAILASEPTTPGEVLQAAVSLLDLSRPPFAQAYLKKLIESKPEAGVLVGLHQQFGSSLCVRLSRDERIQPEGRQLADAVLEAADRFARDPAHIESLVQQGITGATVGQHRAAWSTLGSNPAAAAAPLMRVLAAGATSEQAARARGALVELGQPVVEPLLGFVRAPDSQVRTEAMWVLARLKAEQAAPDLLRAYLSPSSSPAERSAAAAALESAAGSRPSPAEGQALLRRRIESLLTGRAQPSAPDQQGMVSLWRWDPQQQTCTARRLPSAAAAVVVAADLAHDLHQLWPDRADFLQLYLVAGLEAAHLAAGPDRPLPRGTATAFGRAAAAGPQAVEQVLLDAQRLGFDGAAAAAAEVLGEIGDTALLADPQGRPRPLAAALEHPSPRVRMAAARAIVRIDPHRPFPGANDLTRLLGIVIRTRGKPRALVGAPVLTDAQELAGLLRGQGLEADHAVSGRDLLKLASLSPDYDFLLVSAAIAGPTASELLQHLRQFPYTAHLPVGLMVQEADVSAWTRQLVHDDSLTVVVVTPRDPQSAAATVGSLTQLANSDRMSSELRMHHATEALQWLERLAAEPRKYGFYDVVNLEPAWQDALQTPELSVLAAKVLAKTGTPQAQTALWERVQQVGLPWDHRQAAAEALVEAMRRQGVQLTPSQLVAQHRRYQAPDGLDAPTRQLLGFILKHMESAVQQNTQAP